MLYIRKNTPTNVCQPCINKHKMDRGWQDQEHTGNWDAWFQYCIVSEETEKNNAQWVVLRCGGKKNTTQITKFSEQTTIVEYPKHT